MADEREELIRDLTNALTFMSDVSAGNCYFVKVENIQQLLANKSLCKRLAEQAGYLVTEKALRWEVYDHDDEDCSSLDVVDQDSSLTVARFYCALPDARERAERLASELNERDKG